MTIIDYIQNYQNISFKKSEFNEVDAGIFSLLSYFPFDEMNYKKSFSSKDVLAYLEKSEMVKTSKHRYLNLSLMSVVCRSNRYKGIKFKDFKKRNDTSTVEQFQAITIEFKDFIYVSFSGTDATTLGWREDLNMSYLEMVPSEIDAINYLFNERKKHPFKKMYVGGHSKGGRLAIRASKELMKKNTLQAIFSFDGPNFTSDYYDEEYDKIAPLIYEYAPEGSIIGRLISERKKIIIASEAKSIYQHSLYTWVVEDNSFVHVEKYSDSSNKISKICNEIFYKYDNETKSIFVNTLFDIVDKLNITELKDDEYNKKLLMESLASIRIEWKNTPKEHRKTILKVLFSIILLAFKRDK